MRVKIKKVSMDDVRLARLLTQKMQRLLSPQYDYIVENTAKAEFLIGENSVQLDRIVFESAGTDDSIVVDDEAIYLHMDNGMSALLCEPEGFSDALRLSQEDLYIVDSCVMDYVEAQRRFCLTDL